MEQNTADIETVFSSDQISKRLDGLALEIAEIGLERLMVVSILAGSFIFAADLIRAMHKVGVAPEVDFITLSSYRTATTSSGTVEILRDIELDVSGRNVLLVDDILDTGRTLAYAKDLLSARGALDIRTCVLLEKDIARAVDVEADFKAFTCPDVFVVGYGMDLAHRLRELPYVGRIVEWSEWTGGRFSARALKDAGEFDVKILVADDDAATRDLVSRALSIDGHEVQVAADGVEALSILKDVDGLDLLISDISMPGMDGHALAAGAITGIPNLRVILMSALDVELDRANATSGANVSTLSKPFSLDDLRALVGKG